MGSQSTTSIGNYESYDLGDFGKLEVHKDEMHEYSAACTCKRCEYEDELSVNDVTAGSAANNLRLSAMGAHRKFTRQFGLAPCEGSNDPYLWTIEIFKVDGKPATSEDQVN